MVTKQRNTVFYQNVAKLFYAVANADGVIKEAEIKELKEIVSNKWLAVDDVTDMFDTDSAYQIEVVFDWLQSKKVDAEDCYNEFIAYYHVHPYFFTSDVKSLIIETAGNIASAFSGRNKSELIMLGKLNLEFKKDITEQT